MIFQRTTPSAHYRSLRLISEEGLWELGLSDYPSGVRLRMGKAGRPPSVLDFCLGHNPRLIAPALWSTLRLLDPLPESTSPLNIDAIFPWARTRPDLRIHLAPLLDRAGFPGIHPHEPSVTSPREAA